MSAAIGAGRTPQRAGPQRKGSHLLETQDAFMQRSHIGDTLLQDYSKEICIWKQPEDGHTCSGLRELPIPDPVCNGTDEESKPSGMPELRNGAASLKQAVGINARCQPTGWRLGKMPSL